MAKIPHSITLHIPGVYADTGPKILVIKALRALSDMGLKEAKDLSESKGTFTLPVLVKDKENYQTNLMQSAEEWFKESVTTLRTHGVVVQYNDFQSTALDSLRKLAGEAVLNNEFDFAESLIVVLRKFSS